jgi:hypothetical protein
MLRLVSKDLKTGRFYLLMLVAFFSLQGHIFLLVGSGYLAFSILITAIIAVGSIIIDSVHRGDFLLMSLPISRATCVRGRYLTALMAVVLGWIMNVGLGCLLLLILPNAKLHWSILLSIEWFLAYFVLLAVILTTFLPFYFRYGIGRGSFLFFLGLAALLIVGTVVALAAGASRDILTESLKHLDGGAVRAVEQIENAVSLPVLLVSLALLLSGWTLLSMRLSVRFFAARDL